jgi:hypothetical protein
MMLVVVYDDEYSIPIFVSMLYDDVIIGFKAYIECVGIARQEGSCSGDDH